MGDKEKSPAFQFYPKDFLSSSKVSLMPMTERGVYITLLSRCWLDNGLPMDLKTLAGFAKMKQAQFEKMWKNGQIGSCFSERDGRFHNTRLDEERQKQDHNRRRQTDNAQRRWQSHGNATALPEQHVSHESGTTRALQTEEATGILVLDQKKEEPFFADVALRELQKAYPQNRVTSGFRTESAFIEQLNSCNRASVAFLEMRANLENHIQSHEWRVKGMVPSLEKWLRDGLWRRHMEAAAPVAERLTNKTNRTLAAGAEVLAQARKGA